VTKAIPLQNSFRGNRELLAGPVTDRCWARIRSFIPKQLSAEADAVLYKAILECCSWYLTQQAWHEAGLQSAAAVRRSGKKALAPLEQLAKHLREAADIWANTSKIHDDRLGIVGIDLYDKLEAMADDAERRLALLRQIKPIKAAPPFPEFVRLVARHCRKAGLNPTATGRVYEVSKPTVTGRVCKAGQPTWFQAFMAALDKELVGSKNLQHYDDRQGKHIEHDHRAFYAEIVKALRGDKTTGKSS